ncbi:MAG: DNA-directed RNA polymerase subunit omega [Oscillospiraceae bacterium]|jgi:DNA-directed RNA polymerase subunit omega
MLYPSMKTLLQKIENRYLLVNVVARRAREIAEEAEEKGEPLNDKPVTLAIDEIADGELTITERQQEEPTEDPTMTAPDLEEMQKAASEEELFS